MENDDLKSRLFNLESRLQELVSNHNKLNHLLQLLKTRDLQLTNAVKGAVNDLQTRLNEYLHNPTSSAIELIESVTYTIETLSAFVPQEQETSTFS